MKNILSKMNAKRMQDGVLSYFYRTFVLLFMLLTLGVGQMWATDDDTRTIFLDISGCNWYLNNGYTPRIWVAKDDNKKDTYETDYTEIVTTNVYRFEIAKEARCIQFLRYKDGDKQNWSGDIWINIDDANSACCYKYHNYFKLDNNAASVADANKTSFASTGEYLYFYADNLTTTTAVQFVMGRWNHYATTDMDLLTNTEKLYYCTGAYYNDAYSYFSIMGNGSSWVSNSKGFNDIISYASDYTAAKYGYKFNSGSTYYATKSSSSKGSDVSIESQSGYGSIPHYATTLNIKVREANEVDYSNGSVSDKPATSIKITGTYLSNNGTTNRTDAAWSTESSCSYETVISGKVTPTYETLGANWQFDGWYIGGSSQSTGTSFNFYQTSATTVEARFTRIKYDITLNNHGATSAGIESVKATYGANTNISSNITVPSKTGYTFGGYYTGENGTGTQIINASGAWQTNNSLIDSDGKWKNIGDVTLHAKWTNKTTTISFNVDGGSSITNETATYDAAMPSISKPTKDGYSFNGIYDAAEGGTQYYDENAESARTWDKEDASVTLYAHWTKSELSSIALSPDYAVQDENPTITATPTLSISSGIGTTSICWGLYSNSECTSEVDGVTFSADPSSGANTVTFTAPNAAGTYYVKATFRAGSTCSGTELNSVTQSFTVYPTHTVTVKAKVGEEFIPDADYNQTSHTVTVNTHRATEVAVPDVAGYTFVNWTLGSNITKSSGELTDDPIHITATADDNLTANYNYTTYTVTYPSDAAYTISANDASVTYRNTGHFTIKPNAGYSITSVTARQTAHPEVDVPLSNDGDQYSFTQRTEAVEIVVTSSELTNTITIVNGTTASTTAQVATATGTATAAAAPTGKKFARWDLGTGITLTGGTETSRTITFHASQNTTITAQYKDRDTKTVHFAKPFGWSTVTAKFYQDDVAKTEQEPATSTMTYKGANYYTFTYFIDDNDEGDDKRTQANWNKVVFSDNGDGVKTKTITSITNGYYYAKGSGESAGRATPFAEWYLRGNLNGSANWSDGDLYKYPFEVEGTSSATYAYGARTGDAQFFRIYRVSTDEWFAYNITTNADVEFPLDETQALSLYTDSYANKITTPDDKKGAYVFTLTNINTAAPSLNITHPADRTFTGISVSAGANGSISSATEAINTLGEYMPTDISATANAGYRFKEWVTTGGAVVADPTNPTTTATATADGGTITATFTNEYIVYLDRTAIASAWTGGTPYVYFYSGEYWDKDKGSGSKNILWGGQEMTNISGTNIWYYDYSGTKLVTDSKQYIAFTDGSHSGQDNFDETSVIYRADYYPEMNMYVPVNNIDQFLNKHDKIQTCYYEQGYWMKYNEEMSGYNLRIYDGQGKNLLEKMELKTATPGSRNTFTVKFNVEGAGSGKVELEGHDQANYHGVDYTGTYYGNSGSIDGTIADWQFSHGAGKANINFVSAGEYTFTLNCDPDGHLKLNVTFPLATGDFRIKYNGLRTTEDDEKSDAYSNVIPQLTADGTRKDTVSFFVTNPSGKEAALSLQQCTAISGATITWTDVDNTFTGDAISGLATGVYVFEIVQTRTGGTISFAYNNLGKYTGNYYIRTDCAQGGWAVYKQADHIMYEPNYAGAGFDLGFCRHVGSGNVKFCIANKYSPAITKEIGNDDINARSGDGTLDQSANTRFEYVKSTNVIRRSYIGSSSNNDFLYLRDAIGDKIFKANNGSLLENDTAKFTDTENWIYVLEVEAIPGATYKLEAVINGHKQYFIGEVDPETLVGGSGTNHQAMRLIFDYKNNHMIKAWIPNGIIGSNQAINADVMLIREGQADATQLQFESDAKLTSVKNVYGVMGFKKDTLIDGTKSSARRTLYWISYPFEVKLKDIFGFGTYGEDYIIRRYNGALRAEKGWFKGDGTTTFWETMDPDATMNAYEGYMLALDKGLKNSGDSRWIVDGKDIQELYLYFPSSSATVGTLSETDKTIEFDSLPCRIDRDFPEDSGKPKEERRNHKVTDSNWRVIGVGSLQNANITATDLENATADFSYYAWDPTENKLEAEPVTPAEPGSGSATVFSPGHAIMIQWAGKLTWKEASIPASIAARRTTTENKNYNIKLNLYNGGNVVDHTYVILQENASAEFVMNEDLYKAMNSNLSNIYAFAGGYDCGISRIPIENTTVAIGVVSNKAGEYTFSMPNNFSGEVILVDKFAQTRTNLNIEDYEVYLNKGTINDRFELEININKVPTAIDGVTDGTGSLKDGKAHKFIQNGQMYILKNGVLYDARGNRVQ